ncbi:MAG: hypothetical protein M3Q39_13600 [Actinomycetota bacterium]|nr:hypothetical protein [Actinomycetota bacterium]
MSGEDDPTTAAEMELLAVLDDVLDDAQAVELLAITYDARCTMHAAKARYLRGEMSEPERREWVRVVDETGPMIEAMIEKNRERNND